MKAEGTIFFLHGDRKGTAAYDPKRQNKMGL